MNKRTAIKECKELWGEIEESGLTKLGFFKSLAGKKWRDKDYECDCPLCEIAFDLEDCPKCPLVKQYGKNCYKLGFIDHRGGEVKPEFFDAIRGLK